MCMWMRLRLFPWQDQGHAQRSLRCVDPYASLLFDNCAPLNHSIGVHARFQRGTQKGTGIAIGVAADEGLVRTGVSQLESCFSFRMGFCPFCGVPFCGVPWKIFSHAASGRPQSPFPLRQTAATTATAQHERVPFSRCTLGPCATACLLLVALLLPSGSGSNTSSAIGQISQPVVTAQK